MATTATTTKHSAECTRAFGRLSPAGVCPRCEELRAGAAPRLPWGRRPGFDGKPLPGAKHDCKASRCSVVCTFGDW